MSDDAERERAKYEALAALVENYRRERDEAREQLDLTKRELGRWVDRETKAARERDEWRDKFFALNQTAGELCGACGWAFRIPGESCRCEVVKERDEARDRAERLSDELESVAGAIYFDRESARGSLANEVRSHLFRAGNAYMTWEHRALRAERERDDARAEVERLREAFEASEEP